MNYTLRVLYSNGEKDSTPRELQVSLATLAKEDTVVAFFAGDQIMAATICDPKITMLRDGILLTGYEDGESEGAFHKQRWYLTAPEEPK